MADHTECPANCHSHVCEVCLQEYADHCQCVEFALAFKRAVDRCDSDSVERMVLTAVLEDVCPCCGEQEATDWEYDPGVSGARREL